MDNDEYPRAVSQYKMLCWTSSFSDGQAFAVNAPAVRLGVLGPRDGYQSLREGAAAACCDVNGFVNETRRNAIDHMGTVVTVETAD
jgi:hypothetical protein